MAAVVAGVDAAAGVEGAETDCGGGVLATVEAADSRALAELASPLLAATDARNEVDGASDAAGEDGCQVAPTWLWQPALNMVTAATAATTADLFM